MTFEQCKMGLFTGVDLFEVRSLDVLLGTIAASASPATHWGQDERARELFDAETMLTWVSRQRPAPNPGIARKRAPAWSGDIVKLDDGLCFLAIEWAKLGDAEVELPYSLAEQLAAVTRPVFAYVQPVFTGHGKLWNQVAVRDARNFRKAGPRGVSSRTWFGAELVEVLGEDFLRGIPGVVTESAGGGFRVDLLDSPWSQPPSDLVRSQKLVMTYLAPAGVFGDYSEFNKARPGSAWRLPVGR